MFSEIIIFLGHDRKFEKFSSTNEIEINDKTFFNLYHSPYREMLGGIGNDLNEDIKIPIDLTNYELRKSLVLVKLQDLAESFRRWESEYKHNFL